MVFRESILANVECGAGKPLVANPRYDGATLLGRVRIALPLHDSGWPVRLLLLLSFRGPPPSFRNGAQGDCLFVQYRSYGGGNVARRQASARRRDPRRIVGAYSRHLASKLQRSVWRIARAAVCGYVWISSAGAYGRHTVLPACTFI